MSWGLLSLCGACGDDGGGPTTTLQDAGVIGARDATLDAGCTTGALEACDCPSGGSGQRRCVGGAFSNTCEGCVTVSVDTSTKCVAGRYVGTLDIPYYVPGPAGLCGLVTVFGGGGSGDMAFSLSATDNAEFLTVIGSSSCFDVNVTGSSDAGVPNLPDASGVTTLPDGGTVRSLTMELSGSVDCATGKFTGEVKGTYRSVSFCDLGMTENDYFLKGPVSATFDPVTRTFKGGTIDLKEPPVLFALGGEAGGSGTWEAKLEPNAPPPPASPKGCLNGVVFRDDLFP